MTTGTRDAIGRTVEQLIEGVGSWPGVTVGEYRFGGTEWRVGPRESGHVHGWGCSISPTVGHCGMCSVRRARRSTSPARPVELDDMLHQPCRRLRPRPVARRGFVPLSRDRSQTDACRSRGVRPGRCRTRTRGAFAHRRRPVGVRPSACRNRRGTRELATGADSDEGSVPSRSSWTAMSRLYSRLRWIRNRAGCSRWPAAVRSPATGGSNPRSGASLPAVSTASGPTRDEHRRGSPSTAGSAIRFAPSVLKAFTRSTRSSIGYAGYKRRCRLCSWIFISRVDNRLVSEHAPQVCRDVGNDTGRESEHDDIAMPSGSLLCEDVGIFDPIRRDHVSRHCVAASSPSPVVRALPTVPVPVMPTFVYRPPVGHPR